MNKAISPIATTTSLSVLLHSVAVVVLLIINNQTVSDFQAVGEGLDIELVSSILVADQLEASLPKKQEMVAKSHIKIAAENEMANSKDADSQVAPSANDGVVLARKVVERVSIDDSVKQERQVALESDSVSQIMQSTNASAQRHSILELLHSRISSNKEYPYLARRQRREGVARISFVLHPDGRIQNTHMISSSQVITLDRAALSAVKSIQPFVAAQDYLEQAEEFQVNVEFNLL